MPETHPTRRRWFQFGLGAVLWIVTLAAFLASAIQERRQRVKLDTEIKQVRAELAEAEKKHMAETRLILMELGKQSQGRVQPLEPFRSQ